MTIISHHNTLPSVEDLPFTESVKKGGRIFGCQPSLSVDRYREELGRGRIRFADLEAVLREDLGERAQDKIAGLTARFELRRAMLLYPLRHGPTEELLWFMADTDALRRVRPDASAAVRGRLVAETRRWVMGEWRGGNESGRNGGHGRHASRRSSADLNGLLDRFGESSIESWSKRTWEAFTLQALWRVCCNGLDGVPQFTPPAVLPTR